MSAGICRRVFIIGSSGVGKSTLARALAPVLGLPYVPISGQVAYQKHGVTVDQAMRDSSVMASIQRGIADHVGGELERLASESAGYVTDRCLDLSVYGSILGFPHTHQKVKRVADAMFAHPPAPLALSVTVLFIRPHVDITRLARAQDGGRRNQFLTDEWVYRVDGALCHLARTGVIPNCEEMPAEYTQISDRLAFAEEAVMSWQSVQTRKVDSDGVMW